MEMAFILSAMLLICYSVLAVFDGVYLHLYKYRLYQYREAVWSISHIPSGLFYLLVLFLHCLLTLKITACFCSAAF